MVTASWFPFRIHFSPVCRRNADHYQTFFTYAKPMPELYMFEVIALGLEKALEHFVEHLGLMLFRVGDFDQQMAASFSILNFCESPAF